MKVHVMTRVVRKIAKVDDDLRNLSRMIIGLVIMFSFYTPRCLTPSSLQGFCVDTHDSPKARNALQAACHYDIHNLQSHNHVLVP